MMSTVTMHPSITHEHLLILLRVLDCDMRKISAGKYVIQPKKLTQPPAPRVQGERQ